MEILSRPSRAPFKLLPQAIGLGMAMSILSSTSAFAQNEDEKAAELEEAREERAHLPADENPDATGVLQEKVSMERPHAAPPPPEPLPPDGAQERLIWFGAGLVGGFYGLSLLTYAGWPDAPNADMLLIPVAGPWISLGNVTCGPEEPSCDGLDLAFRTGFAVLSGLGQIAGLALIAEGIFLPTAPAAKAAVNEGPRIGWVPVFEPAGGGVRLFGTF